MHNTYTWSAAARFQCRGDQLIIEDSLYGAEAAALFPEFYYVTQSGAALEEIAAAFPDTDIRKWVLEFEKRGFLCTGIQSVDEVFYPQTRYFPGKMGHLVTDRAAADAFRDEMLSRRIADGEAVELPQTAPMPVMAQRHSTRTFSDKNLTAGELSQILCVFAKREQDRLSARYYPSAGGLAPIDVYVYVHDGRVEGIPGGLYAYCPEEAALRCICRGECIDKSSHFLLNQEMFTRSAVSLYLFYNAACNFPKYGSRGYFYGITDAGIAAGFVSLQAQAAGLGSCIIGDQMFDAIRPLFHLTEQQVFLYSIVLGHREEDIHA